MIILHKSPRNVSKIFGPVPKDQIQQYIEQGLLEELSDESGYWVSWSGLKQIVSEVSSDVLARMEQEYAQLLATEKS